MEFKDISMEEMREYLLPGGHKHVIKLPMKLHVAKSGSHRIEDSSGKLHYIAPGFLSITIVLLTGHSGFSF